MSCPGPGVNGWREIGMALRLPGWWHDLSSPEFAPKFPVPAALVYWRDLPSRETEAELRLKISM